jgi:hypothetical protein
MLFLCILKTWTLNFEGFKLHLKQLLTENAFYSFEEFYSFTKSL